MLEKIPEPNSLDSMEGLPRQDIPVAFDAMRGAIIILKVGRRDEMY